MKTYRREGAAVLSLGTDDLTNPSLVEAAFREILSILRRKSIVVDMKGVTSVTSMGLSALSTGAELVRRHEGRLALAGVRPEVMRLIEKLDGSGLAEVAVDVEAALDGLRDEAESPGVRGGPEA